MKDVFCPAVLTCINVVRVYGRFYAGKTWGMIAGIVAGIAVGFSATLVVGESKRKTTSGKQRK